MNPGANILRWTVTVIDATTGKKCSGYDEITISNNLPTQASVSDDQPVCENSASLTANEPLVGKGMWEVKAGSGTIQTKSLFNTVVNDLWIPGIHYFPESSIVSGR